MPSIKRKICTRHGVYETKQCEQCKKQNAKEYDTNSRSKESKAVYNTRKWQKLREAQLRLNPLCINFDSCHNSVASSIMIADHIVELSDGGEEFSLSNLQSMCISCHNSKTATAKRDREGGSKC